jgi:translation initiation factor IF-3
MSNHLINYKIRAPELRVVSSDGQNLGVMKTSEALRMAQEQDMDLVVIAEKANPPVAKVLDYNKFLYEERKKASAAKAKSKKSELKEFVFGPTIDGGDLNVRIERAKEFIEDGNRVKITVKLKGRENEHPEVGFAKIDRFIEELKEVARTESAPARQGNMLTVTFVKA